MILRQSHFNLISLAYLKLSLAKNKPLPKDPIDCRITYLVIVLREYYHQREELGITVWHTMGNNMENNFPNFCIFLIGSGVVSYIMAFCQLMIVDNSEG